MTAAVPRAGTPSALPLRVLRSLLGGGALYFALFTVVHAVLAWASAGPSAADAVVLALVALPQLVLVRRRSLDLPAVQTWAVCSCLVLAALVGLAAMPAPGSGGTYVAWFLGAIALDLLGLTVVGRYRSAWLTMAAVCVAAVAWGSAGGGGVVAGIDLVVRHVATLGVGTAIVVGLRRSNASSAAFRSERLRRLAEEEAALVRSEARRVAVEHVLQQAGATLSSIAEGAEFDADGRRRLLVLEGALRDQIRTPALREGDVLRESLDAARARGVDVLLMDEAVRSEGAAKGRAAAWLAERLDATGTGRFVGRLQPAGGGVRASAVREGASEAVTFGA